MSEGDSDEHQKLVQEFQELSAINTLECAQLKTKIQQTTTVFVDTLGQIKTFLASGQALNITDDDGVTPLLMSLLHTTFLALEQFLEMNSVSVDVTMPNGTGTALLLLACSIGDTPLHIIRLLLEKGADCNVRDSNGDSPLHCSTRNHGDPNVVSLLMQHGAHIDDLDRQGRSALHLACIHGDADFVSALLYWGADPLIYDGVNKLPLDWASENYPLDIVDLLYAYCFDCYCTARLRVNTVVCLLVQERDIMRDILGHGTLSITFDQSGLEDEDLLSSLLKLDPEWMQLAIGSLSEPLLILFQSCKGALAKMLLYPDYREDEHDQIVRILSLLLSDPQLGPAIVSNTNGDRTTTTAIQASFQTWVVPLPEVDEIIMCMLSYGVDLTAEDLVLIYEQYGYCDLFHDLLFMDIVDMDVPKYKEIDSLLPGIYFNVEHSVEYYMSNAQFMPPESWLGNICEYPPLPVVECRVRNVRELFGLFADWRLCDFVLSHFEHEEDLVRVAKERRVPSLLEIGRNVAREHIVKVFSVHNSRQYCAIVATLPLAKLHKDILLFRKSIYILS